MSIRQTKSDLPPYIALKDAIRLMRGVVGRSEFFARYRNDPDVIRRLDIRRNPSKARSITCNRAAVLAWIKELRSSHIVATSPDKNTLNLGLHAMAVEQPRVSYGERLAGLCAALKGRHITDDQFARAVKDLEATAQRNT